MYLTPQDAKILDEAIDLHTRLIRQTNNPIVRDFLSETRTRLVSLSLFDSSASKEN